VKTFSGNIWQETDKAGVVSIGLRQTYLEEKMQECFHILQADAQHLKKGGPMMVIETNDGLESLKSPLTGRITFFNDKARNFPDRLVEDDVIFTVLPEGVKPVEVKRKAAPKAKPVVWADFEAAFPVGRDQRLDQVIVGDVQQQAPQIVANNIPFWGQ